MCAVIAISVQLARFTTYSQSCPHQGSAVGASCQIFCSAGSPRNTSRSTLKRPQFPRKTSAAALPLSLNAERSRKRLQKPDFLLVHAHPCAGCSPSGRQPQHPSTDPVLCAARMDMALVAAFIAPNSAGSAPRLLDRHRTNHEREGSQLPQTPGAPLSPMEVAMSPVSLCVPIARGLKSRAACARFATGRGRHPRLAHQLPSPAPIRSTNTFETGSSSS